MDLVGVESKKKLMMSQWAGLFAAGSYENNGVSSGFVFFPLVLRVVAQPITSARQLFTFAIFSPRWVPVSSTATVTHLTGGSNTGLTG